MNYASNKIQTTVIWAGQGGQMVVKNTVDKFNFIKFESLEGKSPQGFSNAQSSRLT